MPADSPSPEALLIPDVAAAALAGISRAHWHRLRAAGKIGPQAIRLGRKLLFDRQECIAWIAAHCPDARTWQVIRAQDRRLRIAP
jgi:predicted DNA-binding transcriptional regulator AlpA